MQSYLDKEMTCQCGKEITSKLTGELCASCYFKNKNKDLPSLTEPSPTRPKVEGLTESSELTTPEESQEEKPPLRTKSNEVKDPTKKYCQSCIERGYGLVLATREWQTDYFICDDCFTPLLNNIMQVDRVEVQEKVIPRLDPSKPFLNQAYDLLGIPEHLRFIKSDDVLKSRNDIFNYHAPALVNQTVQEISSKIEELTIILFQIKLALEPRTDYINRLKYKEREEAGLRGLDKSEKEYTKGPSKVKMGKDEKMAKQLGMSLETYLQMVKMAKTTEFNKIVNS